MTTTEIITAIDLKAEVLKLPGVKAVQTLSARTVAFKLNNMQYHARITADGGQVDIFKDGQIISWVRDLSCLPINIE